MSLLWMDYEADFRNLVSVAFHHEQETKPDYFAGLSDHTKNIIFRDTRYNVDFLYTAYTLNDNKIIEDYARWLFRLMDSILKTYSADESSEYVISHLRCIDYAIDQEITDDAKRTRLHELIQHACTAVTEESLVPFTGSSSRSAYESEIQDYLDSLLAGNMKDTLYLVRQFSDNGIPLVDIYTEILAQSMKRIGDLWHTAQISVATEHYCTSVTQTAMSQLYPQLFSAVRKGKTLLCACPGTELHEMGARMVADLFEHDGWDSIYLGAAVPFDSMLDSIQSNHPDLVALSVTMPQHLIECHELILKIREAFPDIRIAVGGHAFQCTDSIWKDWPIDYYTDDARELLQLVNGDMN